MNNFKMVCACDPFGLLACKIVEQAIIDWRALIRGKSAGAMSNLDEIKMFLRGTWCEELLSFTDLDGDWVLAQLEKEEDLVCKTRKMITIDGRTKNLSAWCKELGISDTPFYKAYRRFGRAYVEIRLAGIKREKGL